MEKEVLKESILPPAEKVLKIFFALFLFIIVLGSGWLARVSFHILIWHIQPPKESDNSNNHLGGLLVNNCSTCVPVNVMLSDNSTGWTTCPSDIETSSIDITWVWATFFVIIAPYVLTFLSTLFRVIFKSNTKLKCKVLLSVSYLYKENKEV